MPPAIASVICVVLILGLFWLDRDRNTKTSGALWIPVVWLGLACSRSVSAWLQMGTPMDSADQVLEGSPIDRLVYIALLAAGLTVAIHRGKRVGRYLRENGPILLFFLYCTLSLLWSDFPDVAFKRWTKALGDLVMILIILSDRDPLMAIKRTLTRTTYILIPLSILFIKYYPGVGVFYGPWGGKAVFGGVTTNKNTLGVVCLCFGLGALWRLLAAYQSDREIRGRTRRMIAQGIVLAMVLWLFKTADSMTSLNSFLMAGVLLVVASFRWVIRRPVVVHLLIVSMLAVSASVVFLGASPDVLKAMGRNPTLTDRTEVWGVLLTLVQNPLLGTGFESFWLGPRLEKMWRVYWWHPNEAHNGYLEVYLNLGWVGVALLVMIILAGYRTVFAAWRRKDPTGTLQLAYFYVGLVFNFTEAAFFKMMAPAWIFLLFAITGVPAIAYLKLRSSGHDPKHRLVTKQESLWCNPPVESAVDSEEELRCNHLSHTFNTF